jgi:hypothetical protein
MKKLNEIHGFWLGAGAVLMWAAALLPLPQVISIGGPLAYAMGFLAARHYRKKTAIYTRPAWLAGRLKHPGEWANTLALVVIVGSRLTTTLQLSQMPGLSIFLLACVILLSHLSASARALADAPPVARDASA